VKLGRVTWRHLPALVVAVVFLLPIVYMVTGSLRKAGLPPPSSPELVPSPLAWENYSRAFELVDIPRYAFNSLIVAAFAVPLSVLVASWAGFAISRLPGRVRTVLLAGSLAALMVPATALLVPRFVLFKQLGLIDTYVPLIAPALIGMSPFYVLLFYWARPAALQP
jgi:multiple sugar transport system permease protein